MKTAISIPDPIFKTADRLARHLGVSRSHLFARAVAEYVEKHRLDDVTDRLNRIYASEDSRMDPDVAEAQATAIGDEGW